MNTADIVVIILLAAALVFAVRCVKRSKCTGDCASCAKNCKDKKNK